MNAGLVGRSHTRRWPPPRSRGACPLNECRIGWPFARGWGRASARPTRTLDECRIGWPFAPDEQPDRFAERHTSLDECRIGWPFAPLAVKDQRLQIVKQLC